MGLNYSHRPTDHSVRHTTEGYRGHYLFMEKREYIVPALVRGIDVLEYLALNPDASFTEIYTRLGIPKSSAYQLLSTLASRGYVRNAGDSNKFSLGLRLFELGSQAVRSLDIRAEAMPVLRQLVEDTHETCHLGVLDGAEGMYLTKVEGTRAVRLHSWEGKRLPLHSTAMGKILLAWQKPERLAELLEKMQLTRFTEHTITDVSILKEHLHMVAERGWSLDDQENEPHVRCLGAPIRNIDDEVIAAISISGLATTFDGEYLLEISREVMKAADALSRKIGGGLTEDGR